MTEKTLTPGEDFFQYVNDDWLKNHPIPPDKSAYGAFIELNDTIEKELHDITEKAAGTKVGDFYASGMDTGDIERQGTTPLQEHFDAIARISSVPDLHHAIAGFIRLGLDPVFGLSSQVDAKDSRRMIAALSQSGLGLPDKWYYEKTDPESERIREQYQDHIAAMFRLLGETPGRADAIATRVMRMETAFAASSFSPEENRDPLRV
ncbi:MAG TPA: M13 family metallopeptidase N-terminal domain-containing protein, partial [Methanomicrobiales archaeon]|nr:M13 family metallopeptidase N-terminal domain-containing protein [Methanomicrobiales archaeon]